MLYWLLYLLPKKNMSRMVGWLARLSLPRPIQVILNQQFSRYYQLDEVESEKPFSSYKNLEALFTRKLKPGIRPLGVGPYVHPADSLWTQKGNVSEGLKLQFKSESYSLPRLLPGWEIDSYQNGQYGIYYLCPTDYHRVHSPVSGLITRVVHVPGALWPVNKWSTQNIHELFVKNERVIIEIMTEYGFVVVILVAATNVGQVSLAFDSQFRAKSLKATEVTTHQYGPSLRIEKGQELGCFHLGSTVVVITSSDFASQVKWSLSENHQTVRVRQGL